MLLGSFDVMKLHKSFLALPVFLFSLLVFVSQAQTIPAARTTNWSKAGLLNNFPEPVNVINFVTAGGLGNGITVNNAVFNTILASLGGQPTVIYFPPGDYLFSASLNLPSNLILQGEGSDVTTLRFNMTAASDLIRVVGTRSNQNTLLSADVYKDGTTLQVNDAGSFNPGDYLYIIDTDDERVTSSWALGTTGQIIRVTAKSGNTLSLATQLRREYLVSKNATVHKLSMKENVGIENLKIMRMDSTATQTSNILFQYTTNSYVRCIESVKCNFAHIDVRYSTHIEISGSYIREGFGYGGGGRAYGTMLQSGSGDVLIIDNVFNKLRHAMILQSGANGNVLAYNYSRDPYWEEVLLPANSAGDMVLHGNHPYLNLFEGNICQHIVIDNSHGRNGKFNTIFRNRAEGYGIFMNTSPASDSQNFVGNEITNTGFLLGNFTLAGTGHFRHANNKQGQIIPAGTTNLPEATLFLPFAPSYYVQNNSWPPIGLPNTINTHTIAAKERWPLTVKTQCFEAPVPINCVVSDWSAWGACTATCGGGIQTRTRTIITPAQNGGAACPVLTETRACNENPCPIDCVVSDWSAWSTCTATCGGGVQTRTRTVITPAQNGGAACPVLTETRACNENPCPIDCVVSDWSAWGTCTATCGGGVQTRTRTVITPAQNGGAACPVLTESRTCNENPCPIDCVVSDWSAWGECSVECGGGTQTRTRSIITSAQHGGTACPVLTETRACNEHPPFIYYRDADGDNYGDPAVSVTSCSVIPPTGYVSDNTDCDDTDPDVNPGATELPDNGKDDNCDGTELITSIQDMLHTFGLSIAPNPAQHYLDITGRITEELSLRLYNTDGRLLISKVIPPGSNYRLDIATLLAGSYMLELSSTTSGKRAWMKVIVIR
jgi:hypothetical protein